MKSTTKLIFVAIVGVAIMLFFAAWDWFHSVPTDAELNGMLADAEFVEVYRLVDNKPVRWIRMSRPEEWKGLIGSIRFKGRYWQFSTPPTDSIVTQAIVGKERLGAWEVRNDGHVHIRKAARWYKMPIEPGFEEQVRTLLEERGEDLPENTPSGKISE
jgi:hypothetical protein